MNNTLKSLPNFELVCQVLRQFLIFSGVICSKSFLLDKLGIAEVDLEEVLVDLEENQFISMDKSGSFVLTKDLKKLEEMSLAINEYECKFVKDRALKFNLNIPQKLEIIDQMADMIFFARDKLRS